MKILFVTTISNTVNAFLIPHIKLLLDKGYQVDVAFHTVQEISPELLELGCTIHEIEFERSPIHKNNYKAYKKLKKLIIEREYELVHTHTPVASFLTRLACMNIPNIKVLYTAHGFHFYKGAPWLNWAIYYTMEKIAARWTDGIITMNEEDYRAAQQMKVRKAVYKVHGVGIDLSKFKPQTMEQKRRLRKEYGYNENSYILLYTAELNHNKHQDLLIQAIDILRKEIPSVKLLLAGKGPLEEEYTKLIISLGVSNFVEILGYRNDIPNLFRLADLAVSSSRREGLPVNILEAMATGLPLVVTDCRGNRDLVKDGENGYVLTDDVDQFSNALKSIYMAEHLKEGFTTKSLSQIEDYSLDNVLKEMEEIYRSFDHLT